MKRKFIIAVCVLVVLVIVLCGTSYTKSGRYCHKCFADESSWRVAFLGLNLWNKSEVSFVGPLVLKEKQKICNHRWHTAWSKEEGVVFTSNGGHGHVQEGVDFAKICVKDAGMAFLIEEMLPKATGPQQRELGWFIQQASGQEFGITCDDSGREVTMPPDAVAKIQKWWESTRVPSARR
jgi:hypothetical protein